MERKLARTADELMEEEAEAEQIVLSESEDEEEKPAIYNPKVVTEAATGSPLISS